MFNQLVSTFRESVQIGPCLGNLFVDGLATPVIITYLTDESMEIRGLPLDLPPYLMFQEGKIFLDRNRQNAVSDPDEATFLTLYRTWDPRALQQAEVVEPPDQSEVEDGRWSAYYHLTNLLPGGAPADQLIRLRERRDFSFVVESDRLRELNEPDFTDEIRWLTLRLIYADELAFVRLR